MNLPTQVKGKGKKEWEDKPLFGALNTSQHTCTRNESEEEP